MCTYTLRPFILLMDFEKIIGNLLYKYFLTMTIYFTLTSIDIKMISEFFCFAWFVQGSNVSKKIF